MKINMKKVIGIMVLIIAFEVVYLIGFYMPNKVVYGNSEEEITAEISNSESEIESEIEDIIPNSEIATDDLTDSEEDVIIIVDNEDVEDDEDVEEVYTEPTLEDILIEECPFCVIDEIYEIDSYAEGNWYCYYLFADGDVYVVTLKNNHVDICVQLN